MLACVYCIGAFDGHLCYITALFWAEKYKTKSFRNFMGAFQNYSTPTEIMEAKPLTRFKGWTWSFQQRNMLRRKCSEVLDLIDISYSVICSNRVLTCVCQWTVISDFHQILRRNCRPYCFPKHIRSRSRSSSLPSLGGVFLWAVKNFP